MKRVLVFGTFDILHEGHKNFFKQAREHGDYLIVVVARDATVEKVKRQKPLNNENKRKKEIEKNGLVDEVILGSLNDPYEMIREQKPDVICLGYDQQFFIDKLQQKLIEFDLVRTEIIRLKPFKEGIYKSSLLKKNLS